jgi:hypothetical protein
MLGDDIEMRIRLPLNNKLCLLSTQGYIPIYFYSFYKYWTGLTFSPVATKKKIKSGTF